ncbi:MAG TPA: hypothetical protein VFS02_22340 [Telluria sp.]|nr:hypothetical protein [Telluria sp.]
MHDKWVHSLDGWNDTGARIVAAVPSWGAQVQKCRELNVALEYVRTLRISLAPDTWALVLMPEYAGQPFAEPGALLP